MTTLDETQARQVLGVAAEAGIPEIHAAYDAVLDEARRAMGRDEAAMAAKLDTAREAFVFLRDLHAAAHISRPGAPRRAEKPGTSSACREPGERRGVETGEATLPSATDLISTVANQRSSPADLIDIPVRFASFLAQDDRYTGKGRIQVSNRMLVVTARRRTLFAWRRRSESFPVAGIRNVSRAGRQVRFATATTRKP